MCIHLASVETSLWALLSSNMRSKQAPLLFIHSSSCSLPMWFFHVFLLESSCSRRDVCSPSSFSLSIVAVCSYESVSSCRGNALRPVPHSSFPRGVLLSLRSLSDVPPIVPHSLQHRKMRTPSLVFLVFSPPCPRRACLYLAPLRNKPSNRGCASFQ